MLRNHTYFKSSLIGCLLLLSQICFAQGVEISPLYNYHFGGKLDVFEGTLKVPSSDSYGVTLTAKTSNSLNIEVFWLRQDSQLDLDPRIAGPTDELFDIAVDYINIGGGREIDYDNFRPFFTAGLGVVVLTPKTNRFDSETRMSGFLTIGAKYMFNDRVGIRLQGQLLLPFQWGSAGIFCGTGGCGGTVGASTTIAQGTLGGGLVFALGG